MNISETAPRTQGLQDLGRLFKLAWPQRGRLGLAWLLAFATVASSVGLMATAAWLISQAALQPSIAELGMAIVGVRFFGLSRGLLRYCERLVGHDVAFRLAGRMRSWLYQRLEPLAPAGLSRVTSGDLLSRVVSDVERLEQFYISALAPPVVAGLMALLMGSLLAALGDGLALPALVGFGVAAFLAAFTARLGRGDDQHPVAKLRGRFSQAAVDGLQGARELVAAGAGERYGAQLHELDLELAAGQRRLTRRAALGQAVVSMSGAWTLVAVLLVAIPAVQSGAMDGVLLAVAALVVLSAFEAIGPLVPAWGAAQEGATASRRLFDIVDAEPAVAVGGHVEASTSDDQNRPPALRAEGLRFAYRPEQGDVLRGVDIDLPAGQTLLVTGASGSGKSTLLYLLLRFWDYGQGAGSLRLDGQELRSMDADAVRSRMALISQDTHLFTGTLRGNLLLAKPDATQDELEEAVRRARLDTLLNRLPLGYDTWLGEQGCNLSGGERQRLAIARALLQDAPLVLLDEPTAHLDAATAEQVADELDAALVGRTRLIVSHRPEIWLCRAHRHLCLESGAGQDVALKAQSSRPAGCACR